MSAYGELARAIGVILPAEHLVDDVHVAEQIGDDPVVGLAFDVVEHNRTAAVDVFLQAGDFEIRIDRLVGLDQVALRLEPLQRAAQITGGVGGRLLGGFTDRLLHGA